MALAVNGAFIETSSVPAMLLFVLWTLLASVLLTIRAWRAPAAAHPGQAQAVDAAETAMRA